MCFNLYLFRDLDQPSEFVQKLRYSYEHIIFVLSKVHKLYLLYKNIILKYEN